MDNIERLFYMQDTNKQLRLLAQTQEQLSQIDEIDNHILEQFKNLYVN